MTGPAPSPVLVIGIGNPDCGDDAAGIEVARQLQALRLPGVTVLQQTGDAATLLQSWQGTSCVIIIDAIQSGQKPGAIVRFDAAAEPLPAQHFHTSTHHLGLAEACELARSLGQLPQQLIVFGIVGQTFEPGHGLSPSLLPSIQETVRLIRDELKLL